MNKVTTVNLNGIAYQIEENGYDALRAYLGNAQRRLASNPDRDEIISDIERAIAEKFRPLLGKNKNVILAREVDAVIAEIGPVQDDNEEATAAGAPTGDSSSANAGAANASQSEYSGPPRRLYKIPEGAMIAGVCNGIAVYFNVDVVLVRLIFVGVAALCGLLALGLHVFVLIPFAAYGVLALALPSANTPGERAAARGDPINAQDYIRRAKQGYYDGVRAIKDHAEKHRWKYWWHDHSHDYHWTPPMRAPVGPGRLVVAGITLPILTLVELAVGIASVVAMFLVLARGSVLGFTLPEGVPPWVGALAVFIAGQIVTWPVKGLRYACCWSMTGDASAVRYHGFLDSLLWIAVLVFSVWIGDHYVPQVHQFLIHLPENMSKVADALQSWWNSRHA